MFDHEMRVNYTQDDDGIWIMCECGAEVNLGFFPTPDDVAYVAAMHLAEKRT